MNSGSLLLKYVLTSGKKPGSEEVGNTVEKWDYASWKGIRYQYIYKYTCMYIFIRLRM